MRLGKHKRDSDSIQREGENVQAVWSPDAKLIAVLVSVGYLVSTFSRKCYFPYSELSQLHSSLLRFPVNHVVF